MDNTSSVDLQDTLSRPQLHDDWAKTYRGAENEAFMELAFDAIARRLRSQQDARQGASDTWLLDAGCGTGRHTARLLRRGFNVHAVDFSEYALQAAREHALAQLGEQEQSKRLRVGQEDLTRLSFPDASFDNVLCWGVMMHIRELDQVVHQLARVVKPNGWIVIGENNVQSLEWTLYRYLRRAGSRSIQLTPRGLESSWEHEAGTIFVRLQSVPWLVRAFAAEGVVLEHRTARQFTELYTKLSSSRARRLVHMFNNLYFKHVRLPGPASGNLLFFRKTEPSRKH